MIRARPLRTTRSRSAQNHNTRTVSRVGAVWARRVWCKRRLTLAAQRSLHAADAFIRNPLHQTDCAAQEAHRGQWVVGVATGGRVRAYHRNALRPTQPPCPRSGSCERTRGARVSEYVARAAGGGRGAGGLQGQANRSLPVLGAFQDEVVERVADLPGAFRVRHMRFEIRVCGFKCFAIRVGPGVRVWEMIRHRVAAHGKRVRVSLERLCVCEREGEWGGQARTVRCSP